MRLEVFTGVSFLTLDSKNRLFLPPKYRDATRTYVLTPGFDGCILIYSLDRWRDVVKKMESISLKNKNYQRAFLRTFFADAEVVKMDRQGRILIPQKLKERFSLKSQVALVGVKDKLELWDRRKWQRYYEASVKLLNKVKSQLEI